MASIELTRSAPSASTDGRQTIRMFATVKGGGNVTLAGVPVSFSSPDTGVALTVVNGETDTNGQAEALLRIEHPVNRMVSVTAEAAGKRAVTQVEVVGTTVSVSGPESAVAGRPTLYQVSVRDASGEPVVGEAVQASVSGDVVLSQAAATTGQLGTVDLIVTASSSQTRPASLSVAAAGASAQRELRFSATSLEFQEPPMATEIPVGSAARPILVLLTESGVPAVGRRVTFTTTRGTLEFSDVLTDANGVAYTSIASPTAGRALVSATLLDGTVTTRQIDFVGSVAAKVEVQASPSTVGVNLGGSSSQSSEIIAVVRDAFDNPVKGQRVNFHVIDPSAGAGLSQSFAITDDTGRAKVTFYPGSVATGANQITVTATVDCSQAGRCASSGLTKFTDQTLLTAARRALQVRIGTGNAVAVVDTAPAPVFNELPYGVLVSDSADNPVPGVSINATLVSLEYAKGYWRRLPCANGSPCWEQVNNSGIGVIGSPTWCANEDVNENLRLDPGEDRNGDGILTPGNPTVVYFGDTGTSTVGVTDETGSAVMRIRYFRDRGGWLAVRLRVTASVPDGTEGFEQAEFVLPVIGSDLTDEAASPPGQPSPYGVGLCP